MDVLASHVMAVPVRMSFPFWVTLVIGTTYQFWFFLSLPEIQQSFWVLTILRISGVVYVVWTGITFTVWLDELQDHFKRTLGDDFRHSERKKKNQ